MLNNRSWNNIFIPNRIAITDLWRINSMFDQVKAVQEKLHSLSLPVLRELQDDEIRSEIAYLIATYGSLRETIKQFDGQHPGNSFISNMMEIEARVDSVLKRVSLLGGVTE